MERLILVIGDTTSVEKGIVETRFRDNGALPRFVRFSGVKDLEAVFEQAHTEASVTDDPPADMADFCRRYFADSLSSNPSEIVAVMTTEPHEEALDDLIRDNHDLFGGLPVLVIHPHPELWIEEK